MDRNEKYEGAGPAVETENKGGESVEVDNASDLENESSEYSTATTSVASSIFSFTYANGRRYHSDRFKNKYFLPNDEAEQERLDLYHHIFLMLLGGKLHLAPLDNPQKVLDVGTGTGIWAIDFSDENPQAEVIGPDLSPIQPSWVPPNCRFEVDDLEEPWTYQDNSFDYIHIRSMSGSFRDWPKMVAQAYKKTAPGGYVEFQDYSPTPFLSDGTALHGVSKKHAISTYIHYLNMACEKAGMMLNVGPKAKELFEEAGFVDVVETTRVWPIGHWPKDKRLKEIGRWGRMGSEESLYPFGVQLLTTVGWTHEQIVELCQDVKKCYAEQDRKDSDGAKYYFQAWFVYGRKPCEGESSKK